MRPTRAVRAVFVAGLLLFPRIARAEDDRAATEHLLFLALAIEHLESEDPAERGAGTERLSTYSGDPVAAGILARQWFAESDRTNRLALLRALSRNRALSAVRIESFRSAVLRFSATERVARLAELDFVLSEAPSSAQRLKPEGRESSR